MLGTLGSMAQSTHSSTNAPECSESTKGWTFLSEASLRNDVKRVRKKEELTRQIVGEINSPQRKQQPHAAKTVGESWKLESAGNWTRMVGGDQP